MDYGNLPEQFRFSHNFSFFLHDQLVSTVKEGAKADIFSVHVVANGPIQEGLGGDELFKWMTENGHRDEIKEMYYKQLTAALLGDFLNFLYEALRCSAKGKLTVAYALLRKPLKENLLYLEWLLADPEDMLTVFEGEELKAKSISKMSEKRKLELITLAMEKTSLGGWMQPRLMYDLRYNKQFAFGYEDLFQKANHLVTTFPGLETEAANFNFIFSTEEAWLTQWEGLYSYLPLVIMHTIDVVEALVSSFAKRRDDVLDLTFVRTRIGFAHWVDLSSNGLGSTELMTEIRSMLNELDLDCPNCTEPVLSDNESLFKLYEQNSIVCSGCGWTFDVNSGVEAAAAD
ncbi:hypothetical protein ACJ6WJ_09500 [Stenotrophomonas maltophilia]|uniref:hypothetical protein n=2 Tax=Bacteria TaxID=2 RepID=UPI003896CD96